jgi:hypothetical protein
MFSPGRKPQNEEQGEDLNRGLSRRSLKGAAGSGDR